MKKNTKSLIAVVGGLLLLGLVTPTFAFEIVHTNVPFAFKAGNQQFPAGTYTVSWVDDSVERVLEIRSKDGSAHGLIDVELGVERRQIPDKTALSFVEVGGEHYLREVDVAGESEVAEVALPKQVSEQLARVSQSRPDRKR